MPIGSSNFTRMAFGRETIYGQVPAISLREVPFTGESFQFSKQSIESSNINSFRQVLDNIQVGFDTSGGINIEMAPKVYDDLIAGVLWNEWGPATSVSVTCTVVAATRTYSVSTGTPFANLVPGQFVRIAGFTNQANNGVKKILSVAADDMSFVVVNNGTTLIGETTANVTVRGSMIRNGNTRQSFFWERTHTDLDPRQYFSFNGNLVNSFNLSAQASAIITGAFQFMGQTTAIYNDNAVGVANPNGNGDGTVGSGSKSASHITLAPLAFNGLNAVSHVGDVCINNIPVNSGVDAIYMNALDFTITNNLRGVKAIGYLGNVDVSPGKMAVTGSMKALFESDIMYRRYVNDEEFSLSISLLNENNEGYVFSWPRMTLSASSMNAGGQDQDLIEDAQWQALMESTTNTSVQIDRIYSTYA